MVTIMIAIGVLTLAQNGPRDNPPYRACFNGDRYIFDPNTSSDRLANSAGGVPDQNVRGPLKDVWTSNDPTGRTGRVRTYASFTWESPQLSQARARAGAAPASPRHPALQAQESKETKAPSIFWWRYIRGIWPMQQTERVVAASESTNVIFLRITDDVDTDAEYIIVLPEDQFTSTSNDRPEISDTAKVNILRTDDKSSLASITVPGLTCKDLHTPSERVKATRYRKITGTAEHPTIGPESVIGPAPGPDEPPNPERDMIRQLVADVINNTEAKTRIRDVIKPPPPRANCR